MSRDLTDSGPKDDPERPRTAMEMKEQGSAEGLLIDGYGDGGFRVGGNWYYGGVLVLPEECHATAWAGIEDLTVEALVPLWQADAPVEIVLFGGGAGLQPVPRAIREALAAEGLSADPMDTGAAARTFNVLSMEDRRVAAILLPV